MDLWKVLLEENVGGFDLFLRAVLGSAAITALALYEMPVPWNWLLALIAFVGLFSGMTRHCTPYSLVGFSTARKK